MRDKMVVRATNEINSDGSMTKFPSSLRILPLTAAVVLPALFSSAQAANLTWDPTGVPANPAGGNGTWNTTSSFWSNGSTDSVWTNANNDSAIFGGTAGTVTLGTPITVNNLTFNTKGYNITGSTITINGTITAAGGGSSNIGSTITGSNGLYKAGNDILNLNASNTYTGNTTISTGSLYTKAANALPTNTTVIFGSDTSSLVLKTYGQTVAGISSTSSTSSITVDGSGTSNPTLTINPSNGPGGGADSTFSGTISNGSGSNPVLSLTKAGAHTLTLSGTNTYTGVTTVSGGTLAVNGTHTGAGAYVISGGTLAGTGRITSTTGFTFSSSGTLNAGAAGTGNIGTLLLNGPVTASSASTFVFDVGGASNTYDIVKLASLNANNITLSLTDKGAYTWVDGDVLHLFENISGGNIAISGTFANILLPTLSGGLTWDTSSLYTSGTLAVTVPEPSTIGTLVLGMALTGAMIAYRRRRA